MATWLANVVLPTLLSLLAFRLPRDRMRRRRLMAEQSPILVWPGAGSTGLPFWFRRAMLRVLLAGFVSGVLAGTMSVAHAVDCQRDSQDQIIISAGACTVPPGTVPARITAQNSGQITANGVTVSVPFGTAVTAQVGGEITFGVDPTFNGSTILSRFGGGGSIGLLATGASSGGVPSLIV
jgi:hypothetical protein